MRKILLLISAGCAMAGAAAADVAGPAAKVIGPAYARLAAETAALDQAARADCAAEALRAPYQAAWDAWAAIDYFQIGPVEENGRALAISFWPDPKSSGLRAQQSLADNDSPAIDDPEAFAKISVAARGFPGLERLIYPPGITGDEAVLCRMRRANAADLARVAAEIEAEWPDFETTLLTAGTAGNERYLSPDEAGQAIYTQLVAGLEHLADARLGRPLGTGDKPRPERAEGIAAGRSQRNVVLSLTGMRDLAMSLRPEAQGVGKAFDETIAMVEGLDDPVFANVSTPAGHAKLAEVQEAVRKIRRLVEAGIGQPLGLGVGFNSRDGD